MAQKDDSNDGNVGPRRSEVTAACETTGDEAMWEAAAKAARDEAAPEAMRCPRIHDEVAGFY